MNAGDLKTSLLLSKVTKPVNTMIANPLWAKSAFLNQGSVGRTGYIANHNIIFVADRFLKCNSNFFMFGARRTAMKGAKLLEFGKIEGA